MRDKVAMLALSLLTASSRCFPPRTSRHGQPTALARRSHRPAGPKPDESSHRPLARHRDPPIYHAKRGARQPDLHLTKTSVRTSCSTIAGPGLVMADAHGPGPGLREFYHAELPAGVTSLSLRSKPGKSPLRRDQLGKGNLPPVAQT